MASTRQLKGRIRSVKNTRQITKAMQMVAASKMRRAQDATKASTPYTQSANELLDYLSSHEDIQDHPLFEVRDINHRLVILIASDKGLAGSYNSGVFKRFLKTLNKDKQRGMTTAVITVGRKASQFVARIKDVNHIGSYDNMADYPAGTEMYSILGTARRMFESGEVDAVDLVYTQFLSSINQHPHLERVLPAGWEFGEPGVKVVSDTIGRSVFEPTPAAVLDGVAYRLIGAQIFQALLDSRASEHSMRMMAMKNATDNASSLADDLTLAMNKARQSAITQELAEISGGSEAMK